MTGRQLPQWVKSQPPQLKSDAHPRIMDALNTFVDKVKDDRYIIAAILTSNLAGDNVWEHTNINLLLIGRDDAKFDEHYSLVEEECEYQRDDASTKTVPAAPRRRTAGERVAFNSLQKSDAFYEG